ncbi:MAG: endolytic transglycosylase MltG [bacterium]|nr:endolytic transglycosylase MltG [bacterium]
MKRLEGKNYQIFIAIALAIAIFWPAWLIYRPLQSVSEEKVEFVISKGDSSAKVARLLAEQNIVRNRFLFIFYVLATGQEKKFQAGRYLLSSAMNIPQIVGVFSGGLAETDDVVVTIPEGFNIFEIDQKIAASGLTDPGEFFTEAVRQDLEGYLFPDTYRFNKEETVNGVIQKIRANFDEKVRQKINRDQLVVASLLEKEVREPREMALVAGIIYKRLELEMLLQIDASVTYGACLERAEQQSVYKFCDVSKIGVANFLKDDSLYNTYLRPGLPAGPISNPGLEAIKAVLNPEKSDYLFYLSACSDGRTIFSRTAAEHEQNRIKYLR